MFLLAAVLLVAAPKLNAMLIYHTLLRLLLLEGIKVNKKLDSTLPPPGGRLCAPCATLFRQTPLALQP